jgi:hypothetical protein
MKRFIPTLILLVAIAAPSVSFKMPGASSVASLTSNPLVSTLMSSLGLNANQAVGGAGALLGLAKQKLAKNDWSALSKAIPGASNLISQAKSLGGIKKFESLAALAPAFTKFGLTSDQVKSIQGAMTDAISKSAGPELAKKFGDATQ